MSDPAYGIFYDCSLLDTLFIITQILPATSPAYTKVHALGVGKVLGSLDELTDMTQFHAFLLSAHLKIDHITWYGCFDKYSLARRCFAYGQTFMAETYDLDIFNYWFFSCQCYFLRITNSVRRLS